MEFLDNIFFSAPIFNSIEDLLIKILAFIAISVLLLWVIRLIINRAARGKIKFKDGKLLHRDIYIWLTGLGELPVFIILFSIYFGFYINAVKPSSFKWSDPDFYLGLSPQLAVILFAVVLFVLRYKKLTKLIK